MSKLLKYIFSSSLNSCRRFISLKHSKQIVTIGYSQIRGIRTSARKSHSNICALDEFENGSPNGHVNNINKYTKRTHTCGELNTTHVGQKVVLSGWLEYQRMNKFVVLRDSYGETQLLITEKSKLAENLNNVPYESIVQITGLVALRPKDMINEKQQTGEIEVLVEEFQLINRAKDTLPFNIREFQKAKEALRMQYRYLDIRFPQMQRNLRIRSKLFMKFREFLINNHFIDVETPTLFKATPGGAQEFVVPTRFPGKFYSLVQSPQQFKQMLMAGAVDRYFQIAKCYRDEGARSDRQPEFTQLDIELSFTNVEGVLALIEELLNYALSEFNAEIPKKFLRISYENAMELYGSDKPDVSFEFQLQNCTELLIQDERVVKGNDFGAYLVVFNPQNPFGKSIKEKMSLLSKQFPEAKLLQFKIDRKEWSNKTQNIFSSQTAHRLLTDFNIDDSAIVFLSYGTKHDARSLLGKIRVEYVNLLEQTFHLQIRKKGLHFLWVVDFPLFEINRELSVLQSTHHPFTAPHSDDLNLFEIDPLQMRSLAYDLVLNGNEVGGGSIRIHQSMLQEKVLDVLNIKKDNLQHILDMLGSGCPPHGGIAIGLDRLLAVILNMTSIRDVIAFPKTFEGKDPISQAPSEVSNEILDLYHIKINKPK